MKKVLFIAAVAIATGLSSCAQAPKAELKTEIDSLSYAIGLSRSQQGLTQFLEQQGVDSAQYSNFLKGVLEGAKSADISEKMAYSVGMQIGQMIAVNWYESINHELFGNDSTKTINKEDMLAGFFAGVTGKGRVMDPIIATTYTDDKMKSVKEASLLERFGENKAAGEKFLEENKAKEGVVTTESGLQYKVITEGKGQVPTSTDRVKVHYKGTLIDGTEFDSSYSRKDKDGNPQPSTFRANQVIKGWTEALTMMPIGSKWELYIPQELAYGSQDTGTIPPFSTLIFEVELLSIEK
ncbi:MAG: FKBP-type peptidyl-prolyl cis-trans isomerase [Bacteroides sp.]|jgi:FKBP-type peptidyl-prolyl cis-trans isomerase FklB|nr:FKBP-type peptidyl-prolyl cis-trans isomerase [Bacteroides sp.]